MFPLPAGVDVSDRSVSVQVPTASGKLYTGPFYSEGNDRTGTVLLIAAVVIVALFVFARR